MVEMFQFIPDRLDHARVVECYAHDLYRGFTATILWGGMSRNPAYKETFKRVAQLDPNEVVAKLERLRAMLREYSLDEATCKLVSNIFLPELAAEIYTSYCTLLAEQAKDCGAGDVGLFVEWLYDWPSAPENGEDNPRTLYFKEAAEALR